MIFVAGVTCSLVASVLIVSACMLSSSINQKKENSLQLIWVNFFAGRFVRLQKYVAGVSGFAKIQKQVVVWPLSIFGNGRFVYYGIITS